MRRDILPPPRGHPARAALCDSRAGGEGTGVREAQPPGPGRAAAPRPGAGGVSLGPAAGPTCERGIRRGRCHPRGALQRSLICIQGPSPPSRPPAALPPLFPSPSAKLEGRSPEKDDERYSVAFRKVAGQEKRQCKVRAGWPQPPATSALPARSAAPAAAGSPSIAGAACPPETQRGARGGVSIRRFSELLLKPLYELVTRTNCCDFPFRPFSPPPPSFLKGGCQVHVACWYPMLLPRQKMNDAAI